jgi:DNA-binding CsgD family transcriptional regulator
MPWDALERLLLASALLVPHPSAGVAVFDDGEIHQLPELGADELLEPGSSLIGAARHLITQGAAYACFLWPRNGRHGSEGHVRVCVLAGGPYESRALAGTVLISSAGDLRGLTTRELEVLGEIIEGCSNQQIAERLGVAPRTVAAHLEHILLKLDASSRTLAAVRAERVGLYVPFERFSPP